MAIPSGLDEEIAADESIARFLRHSSYVAKTNGRIKHVAFLPAPDHDTSTFRVDGLAQKEIWGIAARHVGERAKNGAARFNASAVAEAGLKIDELDSELQAVRDQLAAIRAAAEQEPDTHDYSEAETRRYLIDVEPHRAGWPLDQDRDREYEVAGMPNAQGIGYADYVLWGDDGLPLAVIEAKRTTTDPQVGQQQAKLYADCLKAMHGRRPIIFFTNGYETWIWDETKGDEARFAVGHFDLVIIDEAHRSVYQKFRAIFDYFDSLPLGLTATPRDQVDKNTYELFDLEPGVPTDAYELELAVSDGFLVPPRVEQVDLKFPREGIDYDDLSDEEKVEWESLDWGDDAAGDGSRS